MTLPRFFAEWRISGAPAFQGIAIGFALALLPLATHPAAALDATEKEAEKLSSCEEKLCRQILDKAPTTGMLLCDLGKTWGGDDIKKGAETKSVSWGFGDAQCSVNLKIKRQHIIKALTSRKYEFSVRPHKVACTVETSEGPKPLKARLAPKMKFEGGKAKKVWIGLKDIDGPEPLSSFVWTTAQLEDTLGIFHSEMIKQVNKFIYRKCEKRYGATAMLKKKREEAALKRAALAKKRRAARAARKAKRKARREKAAAERAAARKAARAAKREADSQSGEEQKQDQASQK